MATITSKRRDYAVRNEILKQTGVVVLIVALAVWQHKFLLQAAKADIFIFALLLGATAVGFYHCIAGTHKLANDFVALAALKEIYEEVTSLQGDDEQALQKAIAKARADAVVYTVPQALGTAHNLIMDELLRSGSLKISANTMQVLVSDVEAKLDEAQGMAHYLGALLVLLGLLGTFIGLMIVLASVGGILGSLDLTGDAGPSAIGGLIESLKKPLDGMATGFGASLLGLIGSLVVGVLAKIGGKASFRLRHDFESWIRTAARIEGADSPAAGRSEGGVERGAGFGGGEFNGRTMLRVARSTVVTTSRLANEIESLVGAVAGVREEVGAQRQRTDHLSSAIEAAAQSQQAVARSVTGLVQSLLESQVRINAAIDEMRIEHRESRQLLEARAAQAAQEMDGVLDHLARGAGAQSRTNERIAAMEAALTQFSFEIARQSERAREGHDQSRDQDTRDLIANLDHLIAASRLGPADVARVRRLAALIDPDALAGVDGAFDASASHHPPAAAAGRLSR